MKKLVLTASFMLACALCASTAESQGRLVIKPSAPPPAPPYVPPAYHGRVPTIGRLPLFDPINTLGTTCVPWNDQASMRQLGIARGWSIAGAALRQSFVGVDARGNIRYLMDAMQDLAGPWRDREEATIQFSPDGSVQVGRRAAWNLSGDGGNIPPQVSGLFGADTLRAYRYAQSLARLCESRKTY